MGKKKRSSFGNKLIALIRCREDDLKAAREREMMFPENRASYWINRTRREELEREVADLQKLLKAAGLEEKYEWHKKLGKVKK